MLRSRTLQQDCYSTLELATKTWVVGNRTQLRAVQNEFLARTRITSGPRRVQLRSLLGSLLGIYRLSLQQKHLNNQEQ